MKENAKFVLRVTFIHVVTYILCGIIFSSIFNYTELYQLGNTKYFMQPMGSASNFIGPLLQVARGLLFGFVLLLLKDNIMQSKYGWLKLWAIFVVIGIINTPGPAPSSIEGMVYTQLPLALHLKGAPETLVQTLLFSLWVTHPIKIRATGFMHKNKTPLLAAGLSGVLFSLSGVVTALILGVDVMAGMTDIGAFVVMFAALITVFFVSRWYGKTEFRLKNVVLPAASYIMLAVAPTVYNYIAGSVFAFPLTLAINIIPVVVVFLVNYLPPIRKGHKKVAA